MSQTLQFCQMLLQTRWLCLPRNLSRKETKNESYVFLPGKKRNQCDSTTRQSPIDLPTKANLSWKEKLGDSLKSEPIKWKVKCRAHAKQVYLPQVFLSLWNPLGPVRQKNVSQSGPPSYSLTPTGRGISKTNIVVTGGYFSRIFSCTPWKNPTPLNQVLHFKGSGYHELRAPKNNGNFVTVQGLKYELVKFNWHYASEHTVDGAVGWRLRAYGGWRGRMALRLRAYGGWRGRMALRLRAYGGGRGRTARSEHTWRLRAYGGWDFGSSDRVFLAHTHAEHVRLLRNCCETLKCTGGTRDHCQGLWTNRMIINDGHGTTEVNRCLC